MDRNELDALVGLLHKRRQEYLDESYGAGSKGWAETDEQHRLRIGARALRAVEEIDAALERVIDARYGSCEICGRNIAVARLRALPATRYCGECARRHPQEGGGGVAGPADPPFLDDAELADTIREAIADNGRVPGENLRIACDRGVVLLAGELPSEQERKILLELLADVLGVREVNDRIHVRELWNQRGEGAGPNPPDPTRSRQRPGEGL